MSLATLPELVELIARRAKATNAPATALVVFEDPMVHARGAPESTIVHIKWEIED